MVHKGEKVMTGIILFVILLGALLGHFVLPNDLIEEVDLFITIALNLMIFSVGIGIGNNKKILSDLKRLGLKFLVIPLGTIIGSLIGGVIAGLFLQMSLGNRLAIASGFGYYSLSSTLLFQLEGVEIGTIAFLTNVSREVLAIILIPFLAKHVSGYSAVSIAGATSMDTTLPLIKEFTNEKIALVSFVHGAVLSVLVPFLVNFFASLS
jgi:uncharacterized membrane protein YbjE (DUF340 family)